MTESEALAKMIAPGTRRPGKYLEGVIQIHLTRACNLSCFNCTQASNAGGKTHFMPVDLFERACESLRGYFGVVGVFGGNPCLHPQFEDICCVLRKHVPYAQRGLWSNNLNGHGEVCRSTFNPAHSNLNVHLDRAAYDEMKRDWPECSPVGLTQDSRHSPPWVAMRDILKTKCPDCENLRNLRPYNGPDWPCETGGCGYRASTIWRGPGRDALYCESHAKLIRESCPECGGTGRAYDEAKAWELISDCDINKHWSALIGVFRGELRAWFCEIAGAQAMLHQNETNYLDTGLDPTKEFGGWESHPTHGVHDNLKWWQLPMSIFREQVRKHCHDCGIPLRGHGELSQAPDLSGEMIANLERQPREHVSQTHAAVYKPKRKGRRIELVTVREQLGKPLGNVTKYLQNSQE